MTDFEKQIKPFIWCEHEGSYSVVLDAGVYQPFIFESRAEEGFEGNGYDWASFATVFLEEECSALEGVINFDPEAGMFCVYSQDQEALKTFITGFKALCEDKPRALDIFSRAELD